MKIKFYLNLFFVLAISLFLGTKVLAATNCILNVTLATDSPKNKIVTKGTKNVTIAKYKFTAAGCDVYIPEIISSNSMSGDNVGCNNYQVVFNKTTKSFAEFNNVGENGYAAEIISYDNSQNLVIPNGQSKTISIIADAISNGLPINLGGSGYAKCGSALIGMVAYPYKLSNNFSINFSKLAYTLSSVKVK